jgi:hypothetical protein
MLLELRRWLPKRSMIVVADSSYAVIELLARMANLETPICMIARFHLDAALYEPVTPGGKKVGRSRSNKEGARLPTPKAVLDNTQTIWQKLTIQKWYGETA